MNTMNEQTSQRALVELVINCNKLMNEAMFVAGKLSLGWAITEMDIDCLYSRLDALHASWTRVLRSEPWHSVDVPVAEDSEDHED